MTEKDVRTESALDRRIEELVTGTLAESAELIPITEDEVARAEANGAEYDAPLPARLREFQPEPPRLGRVVAIDAARRATSRIAWLGHGVAAMLGAAAALGLVWWRSATVSPGRPNIGADPQRALGANNVHTNEPATPLVIVGDDCSQHCCAGPDCKIATSKPKECASERRCVRCVENDISGERYRIRTGRIAPTATLLRHLEAAPEKVLELCFRVAATTNGDFTCTAAQARGDLNEAWTTLPIVASGMDLLSGLSVQLRWRGETTSIGEWSSPIQTNTAVFCSGLSIKPKQSDGELLGALSVFLDDTYYVEFGRSQQPTTLTRLVRGFHFEGLKPKLFETTADGEDRFAATLGPMSKSSAERTRWLLLQRAGQARVVVGADYRGEPQLVE